MIGSLERMNCEFYKNLYHYLQIVATIHLKGVLHIFSAASLQPVLAYHYRYTYIHIYMYTYTS